MTYGLDFITVFSTSIVLFAGIVGIGALPWSDKQCRGVHTGVAVALLALATLAVGVLMF
jgi:hypothetical protein